MLSCCGLKLSISIADPKGIWRGFVKVNWEVGRGRDFDAKVEQKVCKLFLASPDAQEVIVVSH